MKSLGANSYRFSIAWARVIPLGGKDDPVNEQGLQFYSDVIDECLRLGLTPFVVSCAATGLDRALTADSLPVRLSLPSLFSSREAPPSHEGSSLRLIRVTS